MEATDVKLERLNARIHFFRSLDVFTDAAVELDKRLGALGIDDWDTALGAAPADVLALLGRISAVRDWRAEIARTLPRISSPV